MIAIQGLNNILLSCYTI